VQLTHVVMIAGGKTGLAGLPENTTYEAMKISDFVGPHFFGADDVPRDCMIRPWLQPKPSWGAWQKAQDKTNLLYVNQIKTYTTGFAAYDRWYQGAFGVPAAANTVAAQSAAHVLLGPVPPEKITYTPLAGRDLVFVRSDYLLTGDAETRAIRTANLHSELMQAALGGNLDRLWPAAMTGQRK